MAGLEAEAAGEVRLKDTMPRGNFRHVLTLTYPCTKCGGQMEFYDDDREINCLPLRKHAGLRSPVGNGIPFDVL